MLSKIKIVNLFGYYNYNIELKERVTIIHGPNGCGKTTVLKMIYFLFGGRISQLNSIEFDEVHVTLDDGSILKVIKQNSRLCSDGYLDKEITRQRKERSDSWLEYELISANGNSKTSTQRDAVVEFMHRDMDRLYRNRYSRFLPFVQQINDNEWLDVRSNETMTTEEFIETYYDVIIESFPPKLILEMEVPKDVRAFLESTKVQFISADRLKIERKEKRSSYSSEETITYESRVVACAKGIEEKIKDALQEYATFSQIKDRSFPLRVIEDGEVLTVEEIKTKFILLEERRRHYIDFGLLGKEDAEISTEELVASISEDNRQIMSLYAIDTEEKLDTIDDLAELISLYKSLLDNKFSNKQVAFGKEKGFEFVQAKTGRRLDATALSSGEQQELVLLYDLIFNTGKDTLILIDEPELSFHIKWQLEFIDDLLQIIEKREFRAIVATHSPQIINDRWDLTVQLSE